MSRTFVCVGQSHAKNFIRVARVAKRPLRAFVSRPALETNKIGPPGTLSEELKAELATGAVVLSCIGGNSHNSMALLRYPQPFDFILSEAPHLPLDEDAEYIPEVAVRMALAKRAMAHLPLLINVAKAATGPVFHSESPPPPRDSEIFRTSLNARIVGEPAAPMLRYKMWRLHSSIVRSVCEANGVTFLEHPPEAVDAEGFLKQGYFHNATHANRNYARLVWREVDVRL